MKLPDTATNRAEVRRIAASINAKGVNAGFDPWTPATLHEVHDQLADGEIAFDILEDQESRLGLNLADERQDLTILHVRAEGGDVPTTITFLEAAYKAYLKVHGIPEDSADDLLLDADAGRLSLTPEQIEWLTEFGRLWNYAR